jgi:hypothetical protein
MIILKSTDSLQVLLAGAVAANQAVLFAAFVDINAATFAATAAGNSNGLTTSTTAVSWIASPAAGNVRQAKYLSLYNADTAAITVTVRINDGTNMRTLLKVPLAAGDRLEYTDGRGFNVTTASGTSSSVGMTNPMSAAGDLIVGGTGGLASRLALGTVGQILRSMGSGVAAWFGGVTALTDAATITVDASLSDNFRVTLGGNRTLANPTNLSDGQVLNFRILQDATGSRTLAYGSKYKFPGGTAPVLTTTASAKDFMSCEYDATDDTLYCVLNKDFK